MSQIETTSHGLDALAQFDAECNSLRASNKVINGASRRDFALDWVTSNLEKHFDDGIEDDAKEPLWVKSINISTDDNKAAGRLLSRYSAILDEALATKNAAAINEANGAIKLFKHEDGIPLLVGYFEQRTPAEKTAYFKKHSPSNPLRDGLAKSAELANGAFQFANKSLNFLGDNLSTSSKVFLGAATVAAGATLLFTGLGFVPFLATPVGAAFTFGLKAYGAGKAIFDFQKDLFSLPKSITVGFGKKDGSANFEGFPLTKSADNAWKEEQEIAGRIQDPMIKNKTLLAARIKCGKESHSEITKELVSALSDPNPSMLDTMRWRVMLCEQSPAQLRDVVDRIKEKKRNMSVDKYALQDAINFKIDRDADFRSKTKPGFLAAKVAIKSAAAIAPFVVPGMLGEFGEHKAVEIGVDVVSFVSGQLMGRKLDQMRKAQVAAEGERPSLTSSRPVSA